MILMPSDLSYIFFFWKIQLKKRPDRPPKAPAVLSQDSSFLSQHSSFLSQAQLSLIPAQLFLISSTALSYPKHSSFLSRHSSHLSQHSSFLSRHSSFLSHAQLFHIQCIRRGHGPSNCFTESSAEPYTWSERPYHPNPPPPPHQELFKGFQAHLQASIYGTLQDRGQGDWK